MHKDNAQNRDQVIILLADDDLDDRMLIARALEQSRLANPLRMVTDGEELMAYLLRREPFTDPESSPRPGLILLDLNMPRKDGFEALRELRSHPSLHNIPVVVLTTSEAEEDVLRSYNLGANAFIRKPVTFSGLTRVVKSLGDFWFYIALLPGESRSE